MGIFKQPKSPLYKGLVRIFFVVAVIWTGLILHWIRGENFSSIRPDAKMVERVDSWYSEIAMLSPSDSEQFSDLPAERRNLIQKAANSGVYSINGREQKLTDAELKSYKSILENGYSKQVRDTMIMTCKNVEFARSLSGMEHPDRYISDMPPWDFRGIYGIDSGSLFDEVRRLIHQLHEIQVENGWEKNPVFGTQIKYDFTGTFTGLVTEKDLSLLDDLSNARKSREIMKPLFWFAPWIVPLLGLCLVTVIMAELFKWIVRGFRPATN
jgi:hypothetical protein